ncbi:hypothetical protein CRG98_026103 [Punica granatum]|uniref:Uncharacterized protein n=1 Tax=Punica granatum TaxID=22663 RepID=A0A2I0JB69_PUNGR|nr:hypothetical protein CRG98_026103 [Punica granatum]
MWYRHERVHNLFYRHERHHPIFEAVALSLRIYGRSLVILGAPVSSLELNSATSLSSASLSLDFLSLLLYATIEDFAATCDLLSPPLHFQQKYT